MKNQQQQKILFNQQYMVFINEAGVHVIKNLACRLTFNDISW